MNKTSKILSLALGSILALSLFSGCSSAEEVTAARICYDNLGAGYVSESDTTYELKNVTSMTAVDGDGNTVESETVATYSNGVFTAVSEGTITCTLKDGSSFRLEVTPAYVTNPGNQYTGTSSDYSYGGNTLGNCHDPSLIEVEEDGETAYYIFSTGWATGNDIFRSEDMLTWEYQGKSMKSNTKMDDIVEWIGGSNSGFIQWWAPDIVEAYGGGYWLYTCAVSNDYVSHGSTTYSMACIVLFYSDSLETGSFEYQGVLMQSCIPSNTDSYGKSGMDVNSIDPQIIYDTKGNMYMAYGSFGTGDWMIELDPKTGLRKDDFYSDGEFLDWETVRQYSKEAVTEHYGFLDGNDVTLDYYGTMISYESMEAPVIARHDNVKIADETATYDENGEPTGVKGTTYYYSMHSYNGLDEAYQMWGGRSTDVWGKYTSVNGSYVMNTGVGSSDNGGNKYMGSFTWSDKSEGNTSTNIILPGHNDLFTNSSGTNVAAYITRTNSYADAGTVFMVQIHQYYLNSMGDICINPNRYAAEIDRSVSVDELFALTDGGKFKMVALANDNTVKTSVDVVLARDSDTASTGTITQNGSQVGTWIMYGKGYIKFTFSGYASGSKENVYYGVVRPAWLDDQNKSGFTITCMGHTEGATCSTAMFMNSVSSISGTDLVG